MAAIEVQISASPTIEVTHSSITIGGSVRVKNSDGSYDQTFTPDDSPVTLTDITFTDSDGSVSSVPSVQDITATPCGASASISLAASDTTPNFGDTVTLTATATGFTGSIDYTFCVKNNLGGYTNIEQTDDNTYDWVAPYAGTYLIHVTAMDGSSNTAWACIQVTVSTFYVANSVDHAWNGDNRFLDSDHVDVLTDVGVTGGKNATAPSISDRCHLVENPSASFGDMVTATVTDNASNRLQTTLSSYVNNITIYGAFSYSNNDVQGGFDGLVLLGGNGASVGLGSRFHATIVDNSISPRTFNIGLRNSANGFVGQSANLQLGVNLFAYTYDNTTGDWEVIINGTTYTGNNAGGLRNVGTSNFTLLNGLAGTYALPFGEYMAELGICLTAKSSAELAKLYADILLRFPS